MKSKILYTIIAVSLFFLSMGLMAQNPPHPGGGNPPGGGDTPVGGGAPIDGGLSIMLVLAAAYTSRKAMKFTDEKKG